MKIHLRDASLSDWTTVNPSVETEIIAFFENIIKNPIRHASHFSSEMNCHYQSTHRHMQDLDNPNHTYTLSFFTQELTAIFKDKINDLKNLLVTICPQHIPVTQHSSTPFSKTSNFALATSVNHSRTLSSSCSISISSIRDVSSLIVQPFTNNVMRTPSAFIKSKMLNNEEKPSDKILDESNVTKSPLVRSNTNSKEKKNNSIHTAGISSMIIF